MSKQDLVCLMYLALISALYAGAVVEAVRSYLDRHALLGAILIPRPWRGDPRYPAPQLR
jgi:hypothetical protein